MFIAIHDSEFFEKLFKEFGIIYSTTIQNSVKVLLTKMTHDEVVRYLKETYEAITKTSSVKNVAALFSMKIKKGERQLDKETPAKLPKRSQTENKEKEVREKIKSKTNYWLDHYIAFGNKTEALNGLVGNMSEYFEDYSQICEEYYNKLSDKINQIENKKEA